MMFWGIAYLALNLALFVLVLKRRYYSVWPAFCAAQLLTTVQAAVTIFVRPSDVWGNHWVWAPTEFTLVAMTAAAVLEALWKSLHFMRGSWWRALTFGGLVWGCFFLALDVRLYAGYHEVFEGIYDHFLQERLYAYLFLALLAFVGAWVATYKRYTPRAVRMQLWIYSVLMAGHLLNADWLHWGWVNGQYRLLEVLCLVGWAINSKFQAFEIRLAGRLPLKSRPIVYPALPDSQPVIFPAGRTAR